METWGADVLDNFEFLVFLDCFATAEVIDSSLLKPALTEDDSRGYSV